MQSRPAPLPRAATPFHGLLLCAVIFLWALAGCVPSAPPLEQATTAFDRPLPIPPLAESRLMDGTRTFSLDAQEGSSELVAGLQTPTWGFNGPVLGPTLRAQAGERIAVEVANNLPEPTTVHWHGMHLPAAMDGGPHQPVDPGSTWNPSWQIDQPAATLWYHPHPHGNTEEHVYRGLAGMFILDDPLSQSLSLPQNYGVDDIPVIVQDKRLAQDGSLITDSQGNEIGMLGTTILANGVAGAVQQVETTRIRLRLLNGSTARTYDFGFDDNRSFAQTATDGGLLREPHETTRVRLSPGERAEIVVAVEPGEDTMLTSFPPDLGDAAAPSAFGAADRLDVLKLQAAPQLQPSAPLPDRLAEYGIPESDAGVTRTFQVQDRQINGRSMDMDRIDAEVALGATEIWEVTNTHGVPHNWHVHDVQFEVLDIDGAEPPPELQGRKDTIYLEPERTYRLIMRFEDYADPDNPYMYHCHLLLHEDQGLMGQFVVTETGSGGSGQTDGGGVGKPEQEPDQRRHEHDAGHQH
ncbi:multicopper oxidase domain-containing protein [Arthrobacter sp. Sa2BUA2]|uniref:Multicopper oxidase domain-containing protein n=1 Tax=Arthrobacter pullicola TaxID=2762224 RepID=A0ABR8YL14_9MICC|nr:multicopper oxidase domain-containing protein [Arthrobacter pullicola]MBD8044940.1 multicopper oxidase domain-containing protein [Arthrobacter pullicola]